MRTASDSEISLSALMTVLCLFFGLLLAVLAVSGAGALTAVMGLGLFIIGMTGFSRALSGHILWRNLD